MEKMRQYLRERRLTSRAFCEAAGINEATFCSYMTGRHPPSLRAAATIERATDGAVPASSWIGENDET